ncbi:hypothetical protein OS493_019046 [Desmophyllum pertusum]|uniref:Nipped-B protein n=1 Tax=Desmophyllum pertusum TaxID=174260 RepID=A0A9X0CQQ1_9CNID|nr:hypothetical protein OS493_019046 [Desmophyllum pertusum]
MRVKSDQQLSEIDNKYSMFVQMKALAGIKMSFELQRLVHKDKVTPIRGFRNLKETNQCLLSHLYSIIRTGRQPRRSLLQSMLRIYDDHKGAKLDLLLYIADNMAHFPYSVQEEPLFVIYHIDTILSVTGQICSTPSKSKCHKYSPSEPTKAYDKTVSRKVGVVLILNKFLRYVEEPDAVSSHEQLVRDYLEGNVKTPGGKPREKRAPKPRKVVKGRKTPPAGQARAKTKPKGKRPIKKKIISFDFSHYDELRF